MMTTTLHEDGITGLLTRIRGEFLEMPGLRLTSAQAARLWAVDRRTSEWILDGLTTAGLSAAKPGGRVPPRVGLNMTRIDDRTEWLEADGLGGFSSGTTSGIRTRRYHALLLTATTPPTGRVVLVNGFDAWVDTPTGSFALTTQRYAPDVRHPDGASRIVSFTSRALADVGIRDAGRRAPPAGNSGRTRHGRGSRHLVAHRGR